jgi:hypothetical protein
LKPNYNDLGLSQCMGDKLRHEVEKQLTADLENYGIVNRSIKFDWSESCIEGKRVNYLDGAVEDFSSIKVFDGNDSFVAEGWMNFIYEGGRNLFIVYWDLLEINNDTGIKSVKDSFGAPQHVLNRLPTDLISKYIKE